jgi:hypothetical protein
MIARPRLLPWFLGALLVAVPARGQADDEQNAATWYRRAFQHLESIAPDTWNAAYDYDGRSAPSAELRALLDRARPALELLREASRRPHADFELDYGAGIHMTLPHLTPMRNLARLARADACVRLHDGETAAGVEAMAGIFRMSAQLNADDTVISSLVGQSIFDVSDGLAKRAIDEGLLNAAESSRLLESMASLSAIDPFDYVGGIATESEVFVAWLKETYGGEENGVERMKQDLTDLGAEPRPDTELLNPAEFDAAFGQYEDLMARVVDIFQRRDTEQARVELEQIERELQGGEHGPIAKMLATAWTKVYERMVESESALSERRGLLGAMAAGRMTPAQAANAAVLYLRAIESLRKLPAESPRLLAAYAAAAPLDQQAVPEEIAAVLREAGAIAGMLRAASLMERCDFSIARNKGMTLAWPYQAGLRDAGRLLLAEAVRALAQRDAGIAAERLDTALRMAGHLAGDRLIVSSLIAHELFGEAGTLAVTALERGLIGGAEQRASLVHAAGTQRRRDPMGYEESIARQRRDVREWLCRASKSEDPEARGRIITGANTLDADSVLSAAAAIAAMEAPPEAVAHDDAVSDAVARLDGLLWPLEVLNAQRIGPMWREALEAGDAERLAAAPLPRVAPAGERSSAARADFARLFAALGTAARRADEPAPRPR